MGYTILSRTPQKVTGKDKKLKILTIEGTSLAAMWVRNASTRMDATYFEAVLRNIAYRDHSDGYTQLIRFSDGEHILREIKKIWTILSNWRFTDLTLSLRTDMKHS